MAASDVTSDSVASSGATSSPPGSSAADAQTQGTQVDFYVLESAAPAARLGLACRLAEKAYLGGLSTVVWVSDTREQQALDELLWTFMDGSFVPHDLPATDGSWPDSPVVLSAGIAPGGHVDVLINLTAQLPACLGMTRRVAEIVDGDDARRRAGRVRFKAYRDLGMQPATHNLRSESAPGQD
jgi:DNA polymerase III subunit chi